MSTVLLAHPADTRKKGLDAVAKHGSFRKAAQETGIPRATLHRWAAAERGMAGDAETADTTAESVSAAPEDQPETDVRPGHEAGTRQPTAVEASAELEADTEVPVVPTVLARLMDPKYVLAFKRYAQCLANGVHPDAALVAAQGIDDDWSISNEDHNRLVAAVSKLKLGEGITLFADPPGYLDTLYNRWKYTDAETQSLADAITNIRTDAYLQAVNQQLAQVGRPAVEAITDPAVLSSITSDAASVAAGIAENYNRDMATQLGQSWLDHRGDPDVYTTSDNIHNDIVEWDTARQDWKEEQILTTEGMFGYSSGVLDFGENNPDLASTGYIDPPEAVCDECKDWVDRGDMDREELLQWEQPHIGCDHNPAWNYDAPSGEDVWAAQDDSGGDSIDMSERMYLLGWHDALLNDEAHMVQLAFNEDQPRDEHGKFEACGHVDEKMSVSQIKEHLSTVHGKSMASTNKEILLHSHAKIPEAAAKGAKTYTPKTGGVLNKTYTKGGGKAAATLAKAAAAPTLPPVKVGGGKVAPGSSQALHDAIKSSMPVLQGQAFDHGVKDLGLKNSEAVQYSKLSPGAQYGYEKSLAGGMGHADAYSMATTGGVVGGGAKPAGGGKPAAAAPATSPMPTHEQLAGMTKISGPTGSNGGQWYRDPSNGKEYLVKPAASQAIAANEVAARVAYEAMGARPGIDIPNTGLVTSPTGQTSVISEKIQGLSGSPPPGVAGILFGADALTSNWDAVGLAHDNMLSDKAGNAVRVDLGGALQYRAQGGLKGAAFSNTPGSWKDYNTLRDPAKNPAAASVFSGMSNQDVAASLDIARNSWLSNGGAQGMSSRLEAAGVPHDQAQQISGVIATRMSEVPGISQGLRETGSNKKITGPSYAQAAAAAPLPDKLTATEKSTLKSYTSSYAYAINASLRSDKGAEGLTNTSDRVKLAQMDSAFSKAYVAGGTKEPMTVFRQIGASSAYNDYANAKPGETIGDRAFVSTTRDKSYIGSGHNSIAINIPPGVSAIHVEQISHYKGTAEAEVLLNRNANFTREPYDFSVSNGEKVTVGAGIPVFTYNGALGLQGAATKQASG